MNTEAWGILLGHVTGFAAKNACSRLQQVMPRSFFWVALTPLMALLKLGAPQLVLGKGIPWDTLHRFG